MKVLFLYLKAFSFTGGIEKFNRSFLKSLHELSVDGDLDASSISPYDQVTDPRYFAKLRFSGYGGNKLLFGAKTILAAFKYDVLVVGHINLSVVAYFIKRLKPSIKVILITHGIEIWQQQSGFKKRLLESADLILSVSEFTKSKILEQNQSVSEEKIEIFPNTIDPYFIPPNNFNKPQYLLDRYGLTQDNKILLTVTRLSSSEKYKGYDNIISSLKSISEKVPQVRYLLCGKADEHEKERLVKLMKAEGVEHLINLVGFVKDEELIDHYLLADVFVMQSKKEGFGIVFIEALSCGRKVIAGSKDGSVDALMRGQLGKLIDPDDNEELKKAIFEFLDDEQHDPQFLQDTVVNTFGFSSYKKRMKDVFAQLK
jgi:phosphatidylinositol alpha-1,6-mannosyltransferase